MVMNHVISLLFELLTMATFVSLTLLILNEQLGYAATTWHDKISYFAPTIRMTFLSSRLR